VQLFEISVAGRDQFQDRAHLGPLLLRVADPETDFADFESGRQLRDHHMLMMAARDLKGDLFLDDHHADYFTSWGTQARGSSTEQTASPGDNAGQDSWEKILPRI
jgi:hypothetical protein